MERVRTTDSEKGPQGLDAFLGASKKASERGDFQQAERLLKTSIKAAEQQMISTERALSAMLNDLIDLYEAQGRNEEAQVLRQRVAQLTEFDREQYFEILKSVRKTA